MSPRRRPIPALFAVAVATSLLLAGCSSSNSATATSSAAASTPAGDPDTAPSTHAPATGGSGSGTAATGTPSSPGAGGTTSSSSPGSGGTTSSSSAGGQEPADPAVCASVAQVYGAIINATLPILQGKTGPEPFDAEALGKALMVHTMGTLPTELAPDFAAYRTAAEQLRGKDLTAAAEVLNGPEITRASGNIDKYTSDHC